jgi:hypothetical protein
MVRKIAIGLALAREGITAKVIGWYGFRRRRLETNFAARLLEPLPVARLLTVESYAATKWESYQLSA